MEFSHRIEFRILCRFPLPFVQFIWLLVVFFSWCVLCLFLSVIFGFYFMYRYCIGNRFVMDCSAMRCDFFSFPFCSAWVKNAIDHLVTVVNQTTDVTFISARKEPQKLKTTREWKKKFGIEKRNQVETWSSNFSSVSWADLRMRVSEKEKADRTKLHNISFGVHIISTWLETYRNY